MDQRPVQVACLFAALLEIRGTIAAPSGGGACLDYTVCVLKSGDNCRAGSSCRPVREIRGGRFIG